MRVATPAREGREFMISTLAPGRVQERIALGFALVLAVAVAIIRTQFLTEQLPRIYAVIPVFSTAMFITDLLTAFLLFAQFSILRSRALIAVSSGYLYTSFILVPWTLTFPGVFTPSGLLGAGPQTTAWLYIFWHAGLPLFVIAYALLKEERSTARLRDGSVGAAILWSVVGVASLVGATTLLVTVGQDLLPRLIEATHFSRTWTVTTVSASLCGAVACILLWARRSSVLDLWLMVVTFSFFLELVLASGTAGRFSVEWYATRILGLLSANVVLIVLLYETTTLYAQLLRALVAQRRERAARLMTGDAVSASIAHEVRQPLAAMTTNAGAGLRWLTRETPNLEEARAALHRIVDDAHRAGVVLEKIRALFKKDAGARVSLDISELVQGTLGLARADLLASRVVVDVSMDERLPRVVGDHTQLQQVLLNLITNAIDSMASISDRERILRIVCSRQQTGDVLISVEDSGVGVEPKNINKVFDPLFTTKSGGMGMGLAICRSIIEAHQGRLWALPDRSQGAAFQLVLPTDTS